MNKRDWFVSIFWTVGVIFMLYVTFVSKSFAFGRTARVNPA